MAAVIFCSPPQGYQKTGTYGLPVTSKTSSARANHQVVTHTKMLKYPPAYSTHNSKFRDEISVGIVNRCS